MTFEDFEKKWDNENIHYFELSTSGSTGSPKSIKLYKNHLKSSVQNTRNALNLSNNEKVLCCLPTQKVGGFMQWVRAKVLNFSITTVEPSQNPMHFISLEHDYTFVSLVPLQLKNILSDTISKQKLNRFNKILLGGSKLDIDLLLKIQELKPDCYLTYGMTETYSHIALQKLNGDGKQQKLYPMPGIYIQKNSDDCLVIQTPYDVNPIITNDLVYIDEDGGFEIRGRNDFVINSGGIKVIPEQLESIIAEKKLLKSGTFAITSIPDAILGEKVIIISEENIENEKLLLMKNVLPKNHHPKVFFKMNIPMTETGKINRAKIKELLSLRTF
jgi:O-succinylbenzoic acid--CoA ligase